MLHTLSFCPAEAAGIRNGGWRLLRMERAQFGSARLVPALCLAASLLQRATPFAISHTVSQHSDQPARSLGTTFEQENLVKAKHHAVVFDQPVLEH